MKNITLIALLALATIPSASFAQGALQDAVSQIAAQLQEIGDDKKTLVQSLKPDPQKPWRVVYTNTVTDAKGKKTQEQWEFNLADIDVNTVRWEDSKTKMEVTMRTVRGQKFIKRLENGEVDGYTSEIAIQAKGIDNAREIEKKIKDAIPLAKSGWEKDANIDNKPPAELIKLLAATIGETQGAGSTYKQKFEAAGATPDMMQLTVEQYDGKGMKERKTYKWSLGDMVEQNIKLSVSGQVAGVEVGTKRNLRWISLQEEEGGSKDVDYAYVNKLEIFVTDPDQGKLIMAMLSKLIPYGEEQIKARLPKPASATETLGKMAATQQKFMKGDSEIDQKITTDCLAQLTAKEKDVKGGEVMEYAFHVSDLNERSVEIELGDDKAAVEVKTADKVDFIKVVKNGEQQNYDNELTFLFKDPESARLFEHLLPIAIEQCRQNPPSGRDFGWLQKTLADAGSAKKGLTQKLELNAGASCKWKFTQTIAGEKKTDEFLYEFNVYDLDPKLTEIKVSGQKLLLVVKTKQKQKIISVYENGKPSYAAELTMEVADVETAKVAKATLVQLLESCKQ
jgi:hypothetical protein